ncbi:Cyanide hydratase [Lecanosticta acicola]|uniref:Cyanide hydratase n=1 Tax=Lecanosticta acicola TaxID=111012 RepID=A0AAI8Z9G4_9PEZI|nr:Cyanide hydratase [Lecanosticta acicola]
MVATIKKYKAAAVNAEPGWLDLESAVEKTIHWINEAGKAGCKLIAFPELWIPGYPWWMWRVNYQESLPLLKKYRENSLPSDSPEMHRIRKAAKDNNIFVSLGYSEVDLNSLYTSQVLIDSTGTVINHRRKIRATHVERLIFGDGTGDTTSMVVDTEIGRIGQLNCWENMNPFLKAYAVSLGEQVHVAAWPLYPHATTLKYPDPYTNISDAASDIVTPAYAIESGSFTLAPFQTISAKGVDLQTPPGTERADHHIFNGNTRIYGPDGQSLIERPSEDFEGLVFVDIDLDETHLSKALNDFGGHYMRPDLIRLVVDVDRKTNVSKVSGAGVPELVSTVERVGLNKPLKDEKEEDARKAPVAEE